MSTGFVWLFLTVSYDVIVFRVLQAILTMISGLGRNWSNFHEIKEENTENVRFDPEKYLAHYPE